MDERNAPIEKFCVMSADEWDALAREHDWHALHPLFARVAHYYRFGERRDPCLYELRFLNDFAALRASNPALLRIHTLVGDAEQSRVFRDVCRMREALGKTDYPSLMQLMQTSFEYLSRAGITPHRNDLMVLPNAKAALHPAFKKGVVSTSCASAVLSKKKPTPTPSVGVLLAYTPDDATDLAITYATFAAEHASLGVTPIAPVGKEGVLPHLLHTNGVLLDVPTASADGELGARLFANCLLFTAPESALSSLFGKGLPISLVGKLTPSGTLRVLCGGTSFISLSLSLLRSLCVERALNVSAARDKGTFASPVVQVEHNTVFGAITATGTVEGAILTLASEVVRHGGDLTACTLGALLETPCGNAEEALSRVMPLLLGLHRATAELSLPVATATLSSCDEGEARLSIFLAAKKGEARDIVTPTTWQNARNTLYGD